MCGVIGVIGPKITSQLRSEGSRFWAAYESYRGLLTLQHRGQDAAGILAFDEYSNRFSCEKDLGLVGQVFGQEKLETLKGNMAIGHTRYPTAGDDGKGDIQPLVTGFPLGTGMVHNGNILNYHSLAKSLVDDLKVQLLTTNDLEILLHFWCHNLLVENKRSGKSFHFEGATKAAEQIFEKVNGAYALVGLVANEGLFGMRDPQGIRPLVLGRKEIPELPGQYAYCLSSETLALNFLGYEIVRDIAPGEFIFITSDGEIRSFHFQQKPKQSSPCMFEWIYFSGAESKIEDKSVYTVRLNLGKALGEKLRPLIEQGEIAPDYVCPVPDTSRTAAISLAETLGLPYREGLIKNRYTHRSFIINKQEAREKAVELKLSPVRSEIEGKNILLVDDSVVRGTTSRKIINLLKRYGAGTVTLAVTCPPLRYACFYGIDFPDENELIARGKKISDIASWVGADRVVYLEESDLYKAIELPQVCMSCLNGKYPTDITEGREFAQKRIQMREQGVLL